MELFDFVIVVASGRVLGGGSPLKLLPHFGVTTYAGLYERLEGEKPPDAPPRVGPPPLRRPLLRRHAFRGIRAASF